MLAIFQNEWVVVGTLVVFAVVGLVGWGRTRRWLFGKRKTEEETA